jgi:hypothetical protein
VLGPLIVWIRRNLTSHLREPYLDPTLERQVAFNQCVVHTLQMVATQLAEWKAKQSEFETQLELLSAHVSRLELGPSKTAERGQLDQLNDRIKELRRQLKRNAAE